MHTEHMKTPLDSLKNLPDNDQALLEAILDPFDEIFGEILRAKEGTYIATDRHVLLKMKTDQVTKFRKDSTAIQKTESALERAKRHATTQRINIEEILLALRNFPMIIETETETCPACKGEGEVIYQFTHNRLTYDHEADCPICDTSGEIKKTDSKKEKVFRNISKDPEAYGKTLAIEVGGEQWGVYFRPHILLKLVLVAKAKGVDQVIARFPSMNEGSVYVSLDQDVEMVLMTIVKAEGHPHAKITTS